MRVMLVASLMALVIATGPLLGLDPLYSPEQFQAMSKAFEKRQALVSPRQTKGIPLGLALERTTLPVFQTRGESLASAIGQLRESLERVEPSFSDVLWLLDVNAVRNTATMTVDLRNTSALEILRWVTELGGVGFSAIGREVRMGVGVPFQGSLSAAHIQNFVLSKALERKWFPNIRSDSADTTLVAGDQLLDGMGVPFGAGAQADYVPSLNTLSVINCDAALRALETLINESEDECTIRGVQADASKVPDQMVYREIEVPALKRSHFDLVLLKIDGLIRFDSITSKSALQDLGIGFQSGSAVWFEKSKNLLHILDMSQNVASIEMKLRD